MPSHIVLGGVLVSDGIEIKTVRANLHISAYYTAIPRNPVANIVFDHTGQVIRAELSVTSGFADIDGPVLNSLYLWRATGQRISRLPPGETYTLYGMRLLFRPEPLDPPSQQDNTPPDQRNQNENQNEKQGTSRQ